MRGGVVAGVDLGRSSVGHRFRRDPASSQVDGGGMRSVISVQNGSGSTSSAAVRRPSSRDNLLNPTIVEVISSSRVEACNAAVARSVPHRWHTSAIAEIAAKVSGWAGR